MFSHLWGRHQREPGEREEVSLFDRCLFSKYSGLSRLGCFSLYCLYGHVAVATRSSSPVFGTVKLRSSNFSRRYLGRNSEHHIARSIHNSANFLNTTPRTTIAAHYGTWRTSRFRRRTSSNKYHVKHSAAYGVIEVPRK